MKARRPLLVALLLPCLALYLRLAKGSAIRGWITAMLGYEWRAIVEHLLTGAGLPLLIALSFFVVLRNFWGIPLTIRAQKIMSVCFFALLAIAYAIASNLFEQSQASTSVYGSAARGYFQYEQWYADLTGLFLALCYLLWELADNRRKPNNFVWRFLSIDLPPLSRTT